MEDADELTICIMQMKDFAKNIFLPIDGMVITFDDVAFSKSLGTYAMFKFFAHNFLTPLLQ